MSNTNIDNKDLEKLGEFVRENKGRGNIAGLTACDEFGIPIAGIGASGRIDGHYPMIGGMQAVVVGIDSSNAFPIIEMENLGLGAAALFKPSEEMISSEIVKTIEIPEVVSDRGIVIPTATYSLGKLGDDELKENILSMNQTITKGLEPKEEKINLRDHAHAFMLQKDKHKLNFKTYLNSAFRKNEKAIKDKFIKDLYSTKILYKDYKHLNFAAKRLILNNRLRANVIKYCSGMEIAATDILVLLENDSNIQDYLFKNLPVAIRKMIDRGIEL